MVSTYLDMTLLWSLAWGFVLTSPQRKFKKSLVIVGYVVIERNDRLHSATGPLALVEQMLDSRMAEEFTVGTADLPPDSHDDDDDRLSLLTEKQLWLDSVRAACKAFVISLGTPPLPSSQEALLLRAWLL
jgi:hypothetical protein